MIYAFKRLKLQVNSFFSKKNKSNDNLLGESLSDGYEKLLRGKVEEIIRGYKEEWIASKKEELKKKRSEWIRKKLPLVEDVVKLISEENRKTFFENDSLWESLLPVLDTKVIVEAIFAKSHITISKMFEVICEGEISLVNSVEEKKAENFPLVCHAEMRMLKEVHEVSSNSSMHIGIGMLCCTSCYLVFEVVNEEREKSNELKPFTVSGTHGSNFVGWQDPEISEKYSKKLLEKLQEAQSNRDSLKEKRKRWSTSDFPPQNLTEDGQKIYQAYIEQNSCPIS